eukprot:TRINITY_DN473_c0_g1_i3.p1 TRINITY_DN473_c0_g1~~TRINITY_DN473_c0_g1_i3.p1  ORF type:complete len:191 (-),score=35.02 TRINITY_DN473_c0_g1_i3:686-1258(-)
MENLCEACVSGDVPRIKELLAEGAPPLNGPPHNGHLPLHFAAMAKSQGAACTRLLLAAKADIDCKTNEGRCAVHVAAENPYGDDILEVLLEAKADVDAKSTASRTPLHFAAVEGMFGTAQTLLAAKANVNAMNSCGAIPLHWAAKTGKYDLCKLLVDAKSDLNVVDNLGRNPAEMAADNMQHRVEMLLGG